MKAPRSLLACLLILTVLTGYRIRYSPLCETKPLKVTEWDAFGYYLYLPSFLLYHDYKELRWMDAVDSTYRLSGGTGYPVTKLDNGALVNKYLGGIALLQLPFFAAGHLAAQGLGYPPDGYSPPYQWALAVGLLLYSFLALLLLRAVLRRYFGDGVTAATLLLLCLATNYVQYAAVDSGQTHGFIFCLYAAVLLATARWHETHRLRWAAATGYLIGFATMCRPTEAIMLFIPLLWETQSKTTAARKWAAVRRHPAHVAAAVVSGFLGILPQLLYWKAVTGSFIYDVGSKWVFFNPWWRVLVGWEKGWFIYTPVTVALVAGLFFVRRYPFRYAALSFCLLNLWIILSWDDWQYGGSYSTRALVQSYPVFALPLAALLRQSMQTRGLRLLTAAAGVYLTGVNLFQITQYNSTVLHYRDMNRAYYGRIYLNPAPSPLDMSLLDTRDFLPDAADRPAIRLLDDTARMPLRSDRGGALPVAHVAVPPGLGARWFKIEAQIDAPGSLWEAGLAADALQGDSIVKQTTVRLYNPVGEQRHQYAFFLHVPGPPQALRLFLATKHPFAGRIDWLQVTAYR